MTNHDKYYKQSITGLKKYIEKNKQIPTEKQWNKIAGEENYFTSHSLGYLSGLNFHNLCKKIYKEVQQEKEN